MQIASKEAVDFLVNTVYTGFNWAKSVDFFDRCQVKSILVAEELGFLVNIIYFIMWLRKEKR